MGKFLDMFFERDDETPKKEDTISSKTPPKLFNVDQTIPTVPTDPSGNPSIIPTAQVSQSDLLKFNEHFDELFDKANLPGPDYFEFNKMCNAMSTLNDDVKFPAVFGGLQVQGLDRTKLIDSAGHYIKIIEEDQRKFKTAIDQQLLGEANNKKSHAQELQKIIEEKALLMKQLEKEIAETHVEINMLNTDADNIINKAQEKSATYLAACEARKASINSDVEKIKSYIK